MISHIRTYVVRRVVGRFRVPRDAVRFAFKRYGGRTALITAESTVSYAVLEDRCYRLCDAWRTVGISKGSVVFCLLRDTQELIEVRLAGFEAGVLLTQFHGDTDAQRVVDAANRIAPALLIFDPAVAQDQADALAAKHPELVIWPVGEAGVYEQKLAGAAPVRSAEAIEPEHPMGVGFSSGTTGPPKALVSAHGTMIASVQLVLQNIEIELSKTADIAMAGIPLTGAGSGILLPTMLSGGTIVISPSYDADTLAALVERHRVSRVFLTPSMLIDLLDLPTGAYDLTSLSNIIYGSEIMAAAKIDEGIRRFGPIFQQGYGSAEVMPPVSMLQPHEHVDSRGAPVSREILSSAGTVIPEVGVRIVGPNDLALAAGEIGRILVKSPTVFDGYLGDQGSITAPDEWFGLGDVGFVDSDNRLHVLGRTADVVRREGHVTYPRQVEEIVHEHQVVKECCLVGVDGLAVLVVSPRRQFRDGVAGDVEAFVADLTRFIADRVPEADRPDAIRVVDELPRSSLAKVVRREIRELVSRDTLLELTGTAGGLSGCAQPSRPQVPLGSTDR